MTAYQSALANGWKYTLTGFGEFLEMRRLRRTDTDHSPLRRLRPAALPHVAAALLPRLVRELQGSATAGRRLPLPVRREEVLRRSPDDRRDRETPHPLLGTIRSVWLLGHSVRALRSPDSLRWRKADSEAASEASDVDKSTRDPTLRKAEFGCFERALTEKVANLEHQLLEVQETSSADVASLELRLIEMREKFHAHMLPVAYISWSKSTKCPSTM
ncbi:hypothetical protein HPB51_012822 [Rhipicephalus microplus]|uniref:Uncharacterized protein n=1 Tax=Rhipicephalus microplus TaxID=6941 RepID=A0A9J6E9V0_RHIMP|nr:hypothetical protein HPB51_012822 [Rhipicephalus microplus]